MDDETRLRSQGIQMTETMGHHLAFSRAHGLEPAWSRVWNNGQDVTDQPELWPWPWNRLARPSA